MKSGLAYGKKRGNFISGSSSARLEYTSGGRVVAGSNPVSPTNKISKSLRAAEAFAFGAGCIEFHRKRTAGFIFAKGYPIIKENSSSVI